VLGLIETGTELREKAEKCEALADLMSTERDAAMLRQMAAEYRDMAIQVEARQRDDSAGPNRSSVA